MAIIEKDQAAQPADSATRKSALVSLRAAAAGNILEWFDWTLYSIFSTYIAASFFDKQDPASALLSTLAVFAVGFLARPLGALFFGRVADKRGRKFVLVATICTMAAASLMIAVIPSFDAIGVWASVLLLIARLGQGFAHGGESGVSYTYVAEIAPPKKRGLWSSSVFVAVTVGVMLATLLGVVLNTIMGADVVAQDGWRIAFVIGAVLGLFVLVLRRAAEETPQFEQQHSGQGAAKAPKLPGGQAFRIGVLVVMLSAGHNCAYYIWATFASSMAINTHKMEPSGAFTASLLAQGVSLIALVVWGYLSDRIGRRPMITAFGIAAILCFYPISLIISDQPWTLFVAQAAGMAIWAMGAAMYPAFIAELFPTHARATSVAVATSVSVAIFGGTAPLLITWFGQNNIEWAFWVYQGVLATLAIIGGRIVKETKGIDLAAVTSPFRNRQK